MSDSSDPPRPVSGPLLIIDVGHTSATAALVDNGRCEPVSEPAGGLPYWPAAVCFDGRRLLVGAGAQRHRQQDPTGYAADLTRGLATGDARRLGDRSFRPVELLGALLAALRREAERLAGVPVRRALLTVPADHGPDDPWRAGLLAAAGAAGFTAAEVLIEHLAAAYAPTAGPGVLPDDLVLVYDLGGADFEATLVRVGLSAPQVLGHARLADCGGRDVDRLLTGWMRGTDAAHAHPSGAADEDLARRMRHRLSVEPSVREHPAPGVAAYELDRPRLAALAAPVLHRTAVCCQELLDRLEVPVAELAAILLIGGASRMPAVVDLLADTFGRPLRRAEEPELATVHGAVRWWEQGGARRVAATDATGRPVPLAFTLPGGDARLLRWLVGPGEAYAAGQVLGRVRLPGGGIWELTADGAGTVERVLAPPGAAVVTGQWLMLARCPG